MRERKKLRNDIYVWATRYYRPRKTQDFEGQRVAEGGESRLWLQTWYEVPI
jgi:hypothetical protein